MNWQRKFRLGIALAGWVLLIICAFHSMANASRTKPCKTDPRIIQHDVVGENVNWKCASVGFNAQLKGPVWWCTNKITGAVWQITILPVKVPTKD